MSGMYIDSHLDGPNRAVHPWEVSELDIKKYLLQAYM